MNKQTIINGLIRGNHKGTLKPNDLLEISTLIKNLTIHNSLPASPTSLSVGQLCIFGRPHGRQLSGTIISLDKLTAKVQTEQTTWTVFYNAITPVPII